MKEAATIIEQSRRMQTLLQFLFVSMRNSLENYQNFQSLQVNTQEGRQQAIEAETECIYIIEDSLLGQ